MSDFDLFSEMMSNMGGDDNGDLPEVDRANGDSQDSDNQKNARSGVRNIIIWI
jgi:prostaglandin-E synthase